MSIEIVTLKLQRARPCQNLISTASHFVSDWLNGYFSWNRLCTCITNLLDSQIVLFCSRICIASYPTPQITCSPELMPHLDSMYNPLGISDALNIGNSLCRSLRWRVPKYNSDHLPKSGIHAVQVELSYFSSPTKILQGPRPLHPGIVDLDFRTANKNVRSKSSRIMRVIVSF